MTQGIQLTKEQRADQAMRHTLFREARGADREAATQALRSLYTLYNRLRLPPIEQRWGILRADLDGGRR